MAREAATVQAQVEAREERPASILFQAAVILSVMGWLAREIPGDLHQVTRPAVWFFIVAIAAVDLIPVPAWGGLQLSLSFPIVVGVAIVFAPPVAGFIAFLGSADPREFKREVSVLRAGFNRSHAGASALLGSVAFQSIAYTTAPLHRLIPGIAAAAITAYGVNVLVVAGLESLLRRSSMWRVMIKMHGAAPYEFILSYVGLGLFGGIIARFYLVEGMWSVVVFLAPLVFARQMYFRSRGLADRLADQNTVLAEQADRLEELLEKEHETVDELRELNRMKGEFVAVVSHELRTPVTALIGYAKTLRQREFAEDPMMRTEFLERMERQGDRLLRLVENLLTASNLENNQLPVSLGRVLFEDLCREVVEGLTGEAARIRLDVPGNLPVLYTDRQLLGRVVSNLIDNALKYSPDGSPCELGARSEGGAIRFWVSDTGVGIPPGEMGRIFERFYQVDSSTTRTFRGAGLGLSLVQDLLDHLGATIAVKSAPGEGSTFTVTLPVRHPSARDPSFEPPPPPLPAAPDEIPHDLLASG